MCIVKIDQAITRTKSFQVPTESLVKEAPRDRELAQVHVTVSKAREETLAEVKRAKRALRARVGDNGVHHLAVLFIDNTDETATVLADLVGAAVLVSVKGHNVVGVSAPPTTVTLAHGRVVPGSLAATEDVTGVELLRGSGRHTGEKSDSGKNNSTSELHLQYWTWYGLRSFLMLKSQSIAILGIYTFMINRQTQKRYA